MRCAECGSQIAEAARCCDRCGAPAVQQLSVAAGPAGGEPGDSAAIAAARDAGAGPARARRWYFLAFLACCLMLPISAFVGGKVSPTSDLAGWIGGTFAVSLVLAVVFLIAFVSTLSQRRRRRVRQVAWALVPIVSFTVLAWWPFLVLALIRRRVRDWAVFAAYLVAVVAEIILLILSVEGIIPAAGVAAEVAAIILYAMVLLVAVTAPIHTLVAFRPAARLPSLFDAERARAAAKRRPPIIDAGGPQDWQQDTAWTT